MEENYLHCLNNYEYHHRTLWLTELSLNFFSTTAFYLKVASTSEFKRLHSLFWNVYTILKLVRTPLKVLLRVFLKLSFSLSMHLLPRVNVMLDFIWTLPVQLQGTRNKWTWQKFLSTVGFDPPKPPPDYKSTVLPTGPQLAWYEMELNAHEIYGSQMHNMWPSNKDVTGSHFFLILKN